MGLPNGSGGILYYLIFFGNFSQVIIDVKILFGKITHLLDSRIRQMLVKGLSRNENRCSILVYDLHAPNISILFLRQTIVLNLYVKGKQSTDQHQTLEFSFSYKLFTSIFVTFGSKGQCKVYLVTWPVQNVTGQLLF